MNKRQVALLKKLIIEDDYQPIKYFADIFNVSVKTISKDLDEIDEIINDIGVNLDRKQGLGIKLYYTPSQLDKLNILLNNIKISNGDRDLEYRRIEILLNLLINTNQYTTIQKLSDKYMVSRTSINNDLNEIQQSLNKYNLKLSKTLKGTRVVGSEINIRKALVSIIQEYGKVNPNYIAEYQNIRHKELKINEINTIINEKSIAFFEKLLNELETKLKLVIYEPYYTNLLTHLVIMTNRILNGNYINDNSDLKDIVYIANNELYNGAIYLIEEIEKRFQIRINIEEVAYIYKYLTSIGLSFDDEKEYIKKPDLPYVYFTKDLIDTISEMSDVNYNSRVGFYDRLLLHIKPMLNRAKYNIQIKNPLLKDFLMEFEEEFFIVKIACFLICNKYEVDMISDHEVAYILSYFISEDEKIAETIKIKTVVICHSGYGTSQLLATRLGKTFRNIEIVGVIASNSINNIDLDQVDLIVSTVDLEIEQPYIMVSAFLNEIDRENIKNYIGTILEDKKKTSPWEHIDSICMETVDSDKVIEQFKESLNEDNLIYIKDNTYIYPVSDTENWMKEYLIKEGKRKRRIIIISYSDYGYLSKATRLIINEGIEEER